MNKIFYSSEFIKQIKKYNKDLQIQIIKKLKQLEKNPELGKPLTKALKNNRSLHIGKFRVIYSIKGNEIIIAKVDHRKDVYE